ncbi:hypothetical protein FRB93_009834 [Tulasnella sp. JGI-2019a]|nr:hypothetical protein FRB93_009834 [Tulasnella sp. JGI-2019a]
MAPLQQQAQVVRASSSRASTSSGVYAQPTKEWIIAPKSKPGRKPKKVNLSDEDEDEAKKSQIRANQRAFHERKRDQLATLQARVQQLEQGETERYVQLQAIDKRFREENDLLKKENAALRGELALLKGITTTHRRTPSNKRASTEVAEEIDGGIKRKKYRPQPGVISERGTTEDTPGMTTADSLTPSSGCASTPATTYTAPDHLPTSPSNPFHATTTSLEPAFESCGFCTENTSCVCRDLFMQDAIRDHDQVIAHTTNVKKTTTLPTTILDRLPPYQPPVPLRLKRLSSRPKEPIFVVYDPRQTITTLPPISSLAAGPTCSGDPSNCDACSGDSFGQAFCAALSVACAEGRCANCSSTQLARAKKTADTTSTNAACHAFGARPLSTMQPVFGSAPSGPPTTMPTSRAWATLKAHPAIQKGSFNDLHLLADVVARSTPYASPRVVAEQLPKVSDARNNQVIFSQQPIGKGKKGMAIEMEVEPSYCRRGERMVEVGAEGVQQALALLDQHMQDIE